MKTVGIITLQKSIVNYGACLQAYALSKFVDNIGYRSEIVDVLRPGLRGYKSSNKYRKTSYGIKTKIIRTILEIITRIKSRGRIKLFRKFHSLSNYSRLISGPDDFFSNPPQYDIYLSGSDQIWNPNRPLVNEIYLWGFETKSPKISYASSFGIDALSGNLTKELFKNHLSQYQSISVREESGKKIIQNLGLDATVVLDPVFLLSKDEWLSVALLPYTIPAEYIFVYTLHYNQTIVDEAIKLSQEMSLPVYCVISEPKKINRKGVIQLELVGPQEWIGLISKASLFLTDSFHGTSFSIILERNFYTFTSTKGKTNTRIENILSLAGLVDRMIDEGSNSRVNLSEINYETIRSKYDAVLEHSKQYLTETLGKC